jgi:putative CocE/NonD family hydrolase
MSLSRRHALAAIVVVLLCSCTFKARAQQAAAEQKPPAEIDLLWGVQIPVRDGVKLNATIYKPKGDERHPVVFTFTPYIGDTYHERAAYFAHNGYVFALVDVRGRGNSGGRFEPFVNEGRDGYDVVEWLAAQSWSDGKVTMWGGSYAGFDQWTTLKEFPPHLATVVPVAAVYPAVDFPFFHNVFFSYDIQWLTYTSGVTPNLNLFGASPFWAEKFLARYTQNRPYKELDQIVGNGSTQFQTWLKHSTPDEYWDAMTPTTEDYKRIDLPILTITGHYDADQRGALEYYRRHMRYGSEHARQRHYLIIGPWDHAGTRTPRAEVAGVKFGPASLLDMNKLHRDWYDWTLKGGAKPEFLKNRVAYYVPGPGAEKWKYADSLDTISNARRTLYLDSDGDATDVFHSGVLRDEQPKAGAQPDRYTYDPLDTRPAELEREDYEDGNLDQRDVLAMKGDGLVYHTAPFAEDTEITGWLKFVAWIALDVPDTDLQVRVYEIRPDGTSVSLTDDLVRARYRESPRQAQLVKPGEINRYEFDTFQFFSRRVQKGSRLRLVINSPNSIYVEKNYNSGGDVAGETAKDARTAHVTLYHDAQHPSSLEIPVVK